MYKNLQVESIMEKVILKLSRVWPILKISEERHSVIKREIKRCIYRCIKKHYTVTRTRLSLFNKEQDESWILFRLWVCLFSNFTLRTTQTLVNILLRIFQRKQSTGSFLTSGVVSY